jgi:hypothetical protein
MRQASVLLADDWSVSLNGKVSVFGLYGTDIYIPFEPYISTQLVFVFLVETEPNDPFKSLALSVKLPGGDPRVLGLPIETFVVGKTDKESRWMLKYPFLYSMPVLQQGQIEAKVIHENGEIICKAAPFIILRPLVQAAPSQDASTSS